MALKDVINLTRHYVMAGEHLLSPGAAVRQIPEESIPASVRIEAAQKEPKLAVVDSEDDNVPLVIPDLDTEDAAG